MTRILAFFAGLSGTFACLADIMAKDHFGDSPASLWVGILITSASWTVYRFTAEPKTTYKFTFPEEPK